MNIIQVDRRLFSLCAATLFGSETGPEALPHGSRIIRDEHEGYHDKEDHLVMIYDGDIFQTPLAA